MEHIELTEQDLIEAVLEAQAARAEGAEGALTMRELIKQTGWGERRVQLRLDELKCGGRLDVVRVNREALDGRMVRVPAYRLRGTKVPTTNLQGL